MTTSYYRIMNKHVLMKKRPSSQLSNDRGHQHSQRGQPRRRLLESSTSVSSLDYSDAKRKRIAKANERKWKQARDADEAKRVAEQAAEKAAHEAEIVLQTMIVECDSWKPQVLPSSIYALDPAVVSDITSLYKANPASSSHYSRHDDRNLTMEQLVEWTRLFTARHFPAVLCMLVRSYLFAPRWSKEQVDQHLERFQRYSRHIVSFSIEPRGPPLHPVYYHPDSNRVYTTECGNNTYSAKQWDEKRPQHAPIHRICTTQPCEVCIQDVTEGNDVGGGRVAQYGTLKYIESRWECWNCRQVYTQRATRMCRHWLTHGSTAMKSSCVLCGTNDFSL